MNNLFRVLFAACHLILLFSTGLLEASLSYDKLSALSDKEKKNSKPLKIEASVVDISETEKEIAPVYFFTVKNATPDEKYKLVLFNMAQNKVSEFDCIVSVEGKICFPDHYVVAQNLFGYMKGEWVNVFLYSEKKSICARIELTPFPITFEENGYKATVKIFHPYGSVGMLSMENFQPNEILSGYFEVNGERNKFNGNADDKGKLVTFFDATMRDEKITNGAFIANIKASKGNFNINHTWTKDFEKSPLPGLQLKSSNTSKEVALEAFRKTL